MSNNRQMSVAMQRLVDFIICGGLPPHRHSFTFTFKFIYLQINCYNHNLTKYTVRQNNSVRTDYGLNDRGSIPTGRTIFHQHVHTRSLAHSACIQYVPALPPEVLFHRMEKFGMVELYFKVLKRLKAWYLRTWVTLASTTYTSLNA
jgi:hypothetical protein